MTETKQNSGVLFFVGVPKSGSSSLQSQIFRVSPRVRHFTWHDLVSDVVSDSDAKFLYNGMVHLDDVDIDFEHFQKVFNRVRAEAKSSNKTLVLSNVNYVTSPFMSVAIHRLYKLCPEATVLVTMREQVSAIKSFYRAQAFSLHSVPDKLKTVHLPFKDWTEFIISNHMGPRVYGDVSLHQEGQFLRILDYDRINTVLNLYFSPDKIQYLPLELLKTKPSEYYELIYAALGQPVDSEIVDSYSVVGKGQVPVGTQIYERTMLYRFLNMTNAPTTGVFSNTKVKRVLGEIRIVLVSLTNSVASLFEGDVAKLDEVSLVQFNNYFEESNTRFENCTSIPLSSYGYQVVAQDKNI